MFPKPVACNNFHSLSALYVLDAAGLSTACKVCADNIATYINWQLNPLIPV